MNKPDAWDWYVGSFLSLNEIVAYANMSVDDLAEQISKINPDETEAQRCAEEIIEHAKWLLANQ